MAFKCMKCRGTGWMIMVIVKNDPGPEFIADTELPSETDETWERSPCAACEGAGLLVVPPTPRTARERMGQRDVQFAARLLAMGEE